jgi:hypothetical protein
VKKMASLTLYRSIAGKSYRLRKCYSEANGGKSCSELLNLPDLEPGKNHENIKSERFCAGNADKPLRCSEPLRWYLYLIKKMIKI